MRKEIILCGLLACAVGTVHARGGSSDYWNRQLQIGSFRLPPPPTGFVPEYLDLNGDGKPDAIRSVTRDDIPVLWLDDDGDMREGDLEGDLDNDCLLIDRDKDGVYDLVVKYADLDGDGRADLQLIAEYPKEGVARGWPNGHYMIVLDTDRDGVFNYINWNTMLLECWEKYGISDFYTDYSGQSAFIKIHTSTDQMKDLRLNWENPFLFYDPDRDGLSEMAIRIVDTPQPDPAAQADGFEKQPAGPIGYRSPSIWTTTMRRATISISTVRSALWAAGSIIRIRCTRCGTCAGCPRPTAFSSTRVFAS